MKKGVLLVFLLTFIVSQSLMAVELIDKDNSDAVLVDFDCNSGRCSRVFKATTTSYNVKVKDDSANEYGTFGGGVTSQGGTNYAGMSSKFNGNSNISLSLTNGAYYLVTINFNDNFGNTNDAYFSVEEITSVSVWYKDITGNDEETTTALTQTGSTEVFTLTGITLDNMGHTYNFAFLINGSFTNEYDGSGSGASSGFNVSISDFNSNDGSGFHVNDQTQKITYSPASNSESMNVAVNILTRDYEVQNTALTLPVEFTKFTAKPNAQEVLLNWQTATEKNNSHFEVEQSVDGKNYRTIGERMGAGTTLEVQNYEFVDVNPAKGINYYRLKQVDFDGQFEYSEVVSANVSNNIQAQFFPNPVANELSINTTVEDVSIFIFNMTGQLVKAVNGISIDGQYNLNMSELANGMYQVQIVETATGTALIQQRIIKK